MMLSPEQRKDIEAMPAALRELVEAELAAGNEIDEVGHSFPAAPVGCYVKLARPVSSRPRASSEGISFYDRNSSLYSGEFADEKRWFFVLEPPNPPPPEPDMDAIRAAANRSVHTPITPVSAQGPDGQPAAQSALDRFRQSMVIDYDKWHDGVGYDLDVLRLATPSELVAIEQLLVSRNVNDWRDVEALAAINSPQARVALVDAHRRGNHEIKLAVTEYAPDLIPQEARLASLLAALKGADFYGGLTQALREVEQFHPPEVIDELFRGALRRNGQNAVHFAAMLMYLHGKADSTFDWALRPFFLRFNTKDPRERLQCVRELCERIGVDAEEVLERCN